MEAHLISPNTTASLSRVSSRACAPARAEPDPARRSTMLLVDRRGGIDAVATAFLAPPPARRGGPRAARRGARRPSFPGS